LGTTKSLIEHLKQRGHKLETGTLVSSVAITGVHDSSLGVRSKISFDGEGEFN